MNTNNYYDEEYIREWRKKAYENALKYGIVSGSFINEETYRVLDNSERSIKCEYCQTHIVERDKFHLGNCPECGAPLFGK